MFDRNNNLVEIGDRVHFSEGGLDFKSYGKVVSIYHGHNLYGGPIASIWVEGKTDELLWRRYGNDLEKVPHAR